VNTSRCAFLALAAFLCAPAALPAQDSTSGKIGDVQRSADNAKKKGGGGDEEGGGGWFLGSWDAFGHVFFGVFPRDTGQGYESHPYAGGGPFVRRRVTEGRRFGSVSGTYFADDQSTLRAMHFAVEWAGGLFRREVEFSSYWEPLSGHTDHLQMFRISFTAVPPLGDVGFLRIGAGFQLVTTGGDAATGPEIEAGVQLFPRRPYGFGATARVAPLTWSGGPEWGVGFVDLGANGSVFVGALELQLGYRWTRIGVGAPFRGPTLGLRVWF
jgi:hypothetical protein